MIKAVVLVVCVIGLLAAQVTVLEESSFDGAVGGDKHVLVEFYAPWCGHCKNLEPVYNELGDAFGKVSNVVIAKVDATENRALAEKYGVTGYPTLKWFPAGSAEAEKYEGGRNLEDLISFVEGKTNTRAVRVVKPSDVVTLTPANFNQVVQTPDAKVFVKFYAPWCGHCKKLAPTWEKLATAFKSDKNVVIAKVNADDHRDLGSRFGVTGFPTLKFFTNGEAGDNYGGGRELADLVAHVNEVAGTYRLDSGMLNDVAGRTAALDAIIEQFSKDGDKDAALKAIDAAEAPAVAGVDAAFVQKVYAATVKKVADNANFVATEKARLQRMLEGSSLSLEARDKFKVRFNILTAFQSEE